MDHDLIPHENTGGTVVAHVMLCVKEEWVVWLASPEMIVTNKNEVYVGLVREFKRNIGKHRNNKQCSKGK